METIISDILKILEGRAKIWLLIEILEDDTAIKKISSCNILKSELRKGKEIETKKNVYNYFEEEKEYSMIYRYEWHECGKGENNEIGDKMGNIVRGIWKYMKKWSVECWRENGWTIEYYGFDEEQAKKIYDNIWSDMIYRIEIDGKKYYESVKLKKYEMEKIIVINYDNSIFV